MVGKNWNHSKTGNGSVSEDAETRPAFLFCKKREDFLNSCLSKHAAVNPLLLFTSPLSSSREGKVFFLQIQFFPLWWKKVCSENLILQRVEYPVLRAQEAFKKKHCTFIHASHTYSISVSPSLHQIVQAKELYSCKERCTWYRAFKQLQCVTCTWEQLSLKPQRKLFVELDIWSFSWTLQGETVRGNPLIRSGRLWAPPANEQLQHFKVLSLHTPQVGSGRGHQSLLMSAKLLGECTKNLTSSVFNFNSKWRHAISLLCSRVSKVISSVPLVLC